jgi:hypothetical protein
VEYTIPPSECVPERYYVVSKTSDTWKCVGIHYGNSGVGMTVFLNTKTGKLTDLGSVPHTSNLRFAEVPGPQYRVNYDKLDTRKIEIHAKLHELWKPEQKLQNLLVSPEFLEYFLVEVFYCVEER